MVTATEPSIETVWHWLADVADPEIPAISVVDLGIVRDVRYDDASAGARRLVVTITPTYSGCPATMTIERTIAQMLRDRGLRDAKLEIQLTPAWTSDWLTAGGREKLRAYGIAPPEEAAGAVGIDLLRPTAARVACPRCAATDVALVSRFGSTPCKALYRCNACLEPFDHFKCH